MAVPLGLALLVVPGCEEADENVIFNVGTSLLMLASLALLGQVGEEGRAEIEALGVGQLGWEVDLG